MLIFLVQISSLSPHRTTPSLFFLKNMQSSRVVAFESTLKRMPSGRTSLVRSSQPHQPQPPSVRTTTATCPTTSRHSARESLPCAVPHMARSAAKKRPRDTMVTRASNGGGGEEFGLQGRSTRRDEASTVLALSAGFGARARARRRWLAAEPRPISAGEEVHGMRRNARALHCTARASQLAWEPHARCTVRGASLHCPLPCIYRPAFVSVNA